MGGLAARLLMRGDSIAIEQGRLIILPASGAPVPDDWLATNGDTIAAEIARAAGVEAFRYIGYSAGRYGVRRSGGVRLQLISIVTGEEVAVFFNAGLDRLRDSRGGKAGEPLPKGEFRVGTRSAFYKFWLSTGLVIPNRTSKFHKHMGTLQRVLLTGEVANGRVNAQSLRPLDVAEATVRISIVGDKEGTDWGQGRDKEGTALRDNETSMTHAHQRLQPDQGACAPKCVYTSTSRDVSRGLSTHPLTPDTPEVRKPPQEQTTDEWLAAYGPVGSK